MTAKEVIALLGLKPLEPEGGFFKETYRGKLDPAGGRAVSTAIYYLLTQRTSSAIHRLSSDEIYHFYLGSPVEMLMLRSNGTGEQITLGSDLASGERPQLVVPAGVWQGARLIGRGEFALLGTTVAPGFEFSDYEPGETESLVRDFPAMAANIRRLSRRPLPLIDKKSV